MQETVLGLVGMTSSTFEQPPPEELRDSATTEHDIDGQPFEGKRHLYPLLASGGLWTPPSDLARFAIEIVRARAGESDRLRAQEMADEILTSQSEVHDSSLRDSYGLGFDLAGEGQEFRSMHSGGTWGSTCVLWMHPETGRRRHHDQLCSRSGCYPIRDLAQHCCRIRMAAGCSRQGDAGDV
jgi:CubicO group peptidase (beta-lactamase class C family)